jgi:acetoin utilization protein AcuB
MKVGEVMKADLITVGQDETVGAISDLFERRRFHHLLVTDQGVLIGVISDRDLLRNVSPFVGSVFAERPQDLALLNRRAHQIMSRRPITASPGMGVEEAARRMLHHTISCLPVVDEGRRPVGIVTTKDLLRLFLAGVPFRPPAVPAGPA